ncbi:MULTISPECIES: type III secretion system cytoplasmic ring protein SctQ [Pandoraea]|uniref:type III secretion system cytoplasmic ring protein SctQ n=1 Tax=Pandoraea TaxID=93217 RepID=UPI001F5DC44C|nr:MULTISPECIES: type III secretion system cytoplasmic ring protein SctQ [Pandoraea]MCI3208275.1 YscQ/HrcQ family type III secretion apparatus protein [Pandoraea sp. LA3]MDN4586304.1 YscQ/HrcQ family type III secretion apparatus protein [Pandoraea capi]
MNTTPSLSPTPSPLPLRRYRPALASVARWLVRDATYGLQVSTGPASLRSGALARLVLGSAFGELRLRVDLSRAPALAAMARDPDTLRARILVNLYLDVHLAALRRAGIAGLVVRECEWDDAPLADEALPIATRDGEITGAIESVDDTFADALAGIHLVQTTTRPDVVHAVDAIDTLCLPCRLCLSRQKVALSLLASLRPGDVLFGWHDPLPPDAAQDAPLSIWLPDAAPTNASGATGWVAYAMRLGASLTLTSPFAMTTDFNADLPDWHAGDDMSEGFDAHTAPDARLTATDTDIDTGIHAMPSADTAPDTSPVGVVASGNPLAGLVVPLHLEVGTLDLTLADIARMQPGYLLELPNAAACAQVRLTVHGQTVGHGELVAIGEHLGVQITHMDARA